MVSDALEEEVLIFEFVLTNDGAGHNIMIFEQDIRNVMMIKEHSQVHIIIQTHIFDMKNSVAKAVQKSVFFKFCTIRPNPKVLLSTKVFFKFYIIVPNPKVYVLHGTQ